MPLTAGTRIGPYEILGPLGAGGMGEVHRARDTRLNRDIAIKALPPLFSVLPGRAARFEREAQILASLNHPNIGGIYGLEESAGERYLVLELVPGESLDRRLAAGPLPVHEALAIARQIADALEAAHEKGIIHRDLKPGNVMLTPDGQVKVLDFGLAKPSEADAASGSAVNSPTLTSPAMLTQAGMLVGTAAYMSPEQARGRPVDRRSDVWAFGCVVYELLTGRRAFVGEDVAETLAAILRGDPDWSALPPLPPAVDALLRRCLDRDPRKRVGDMSTARFVLEHSDVLSGTTATRAVPPSPRSLARRLAPLTPLALAIAAIAVFGIWRPQPRPPATAVTRFAVTLPEGQMLGPTRRMVAVSPDGSEVLYVADNHIFLRRISDFDAQPIPITGTGPNINSPVFSPDGSSVAFHTEDGVKRVSVRGGAAIAVCDIGIPMSVTWDDSGILIGAGAAGIVRCNPAGGAPEPVVKPGPNELLLSPQMLPGGSAMVLTVARTDLTVSRFDRAEIVVQSLKDGSRRTLVANAMDPHVTRNGYLLYIAGGILFAVRFDPARQAISGDPVPLVEGVRRTGAESGTSQLAVSDGGTLVYVPGPVGSFTGHYDLAIADRSGSISRVPAPPGYYAQVRVSPDGRRAVVETDDEKNAIVWVYDLDGHDAMQRLTLRGNNRYPIWSPDGTSVAFESDRDGPHGIYRERIDMGSAAERLTTAAPGETHIPQSWSPDGHHLAFAVRKDTGKQTATYSLWILSLPAKHVERFDEVGSSQPPEAVFSPDGRWIAYASGSTANTGSADNGVFVQPFPATGAVFQAPRQIVDFHPVWAPGGKELVFIAASTAGQMAAVPVSTTNGITFGTAVRFPAGVTGDRLSSQTRAYDVLPDGRFIGIVRGTVSGGRVYSDIHVVLNWPQAIQERSAR